MSSIWFEKYKPSKISELVLPTHLKDKLQKNVNNEDIPNLGLFSRFGGTGKSATSHAIIKEIDGEALWINASLERGIDTLRGKIGKFASQNSFDDKIKIVVMDECDNLSQDAQAAFRGFIDEYSKNCRFILTGNYPEKIIEPLLNRLEVYDFNQFDSKEMIKPIYSKLEHILNTEGVSFEPKDVARLIKASYPSIRAMISNLQKFSSTGTLILSEADLDSSSSFDTVMKSTKYMELIQNINSLSAPESMFTFLYQNLDVYFKDSEYQKVVITIAKYAEMSSNVRDKHLNLSACLTELWGLRK